jgi:hypothetical protein
VLRSKGLTRADQIVPLELDFVWKPYLPLGVVSIIEGDPGLLKSYMTVAIVAETLPGSMIYTAEDSARVIEHNRRTRTASWSNLT